MRDIFWGEFDTAELCGPNTIKGLAEAEFDRYKDDVSCLTDLVMVINHKSWHHNDRGHDSLCELYADLYYKYYEKAINYLEAENREEDLTYLIRTLD